MDRHQARSRARLAETVPTQVVPWTVIKRWFEAGSYVPYASDQMFELLMQVNLLLLLLLL